MKNQTNLMIGLIAQTSIHAGAGSSAGAVDLPIQREGHNGWPCIFGSSVKGALRTKAEQVLTASDGKRDDATLNTIFGPDTQNASDHAGAISVGDARLLLLPVRSLTSAFKWVTCPAALDRFKRDSAMLGKELTFTTPTIPQKNNAETALCTTGENLFLEEYRFTVDSVNLDAVINALCELVKRDHFAEALKEQLAIVSNDMFAHLARSATPINAHIALKDDGSKTVAKGALWYEETLPPETVLYVPIMAQKSRNQKKPIDATAIAASVSGILTNQPWLQVGGNETVGMGWCAVNVTTIGGL